MRQALPSHLAVLAEELIAHDPGFFHFDASQAQTLRDVFLAAWGEFPNGDEMQREGCARIERSVPFARGPMRRVRLTDREQAIVFWFDPEVPERVFASLSTSFPPFLWLPLEPTVDAFTRGLAPYLDRPFSSPHVLARSVRIHRGSLEDLGMRDIEHFSQVIARLESWMDGEAVWGSEHIEDPWPEDPTSASMLTLRAIANRAREQHPAGAESLSMRTLWSRSIITVEQGRFGEVVFDIKYDPAPHVADLPANDGRLDVPFDLPLDVLPSLIRAASMTQFRAREMRASTAMTPWLAMVTAVLEPTESTTVAMLREMIRDPELAQAAVEIAHGIGARAILYEAYLTTEVLELKIQLGALLKLEPARSTSSEEQEVQS